MKRTIAGAYFAAVCLHSVLWLRGLVWPGAASGDVAEMLGILVVVASPLILVAALLGLLEPRTPVTRITALIVLSLCVEVFRAVSTVHAPKRLGEGAIAAISLLLGVVGMIVVATGRRQRSAARGDAGVGDAGQQGLEPDGRREL